MDDETMWLVDIYNNVVKEVKPHLQRDPMARFISGHGVARINVDLFYTEQRACEVAAERLLRQAERLRARAEQLAAVTD